MKQEKKRIRSVGKYHFETIKVCVETDVLFTRCRVCKQLKPSNLDFFRKASNQDSERLIQPLCIECAREMEKEQRKYEKEKRMEAEKPITNVEQKELFDGKVFTKEDSNETLEYKINKIFNFFGLK